MDANYIDVFVVQSGSRKVNDSIIELVSIFYQLKGSAYEKQLILISACKGGSANKITGKLLRVNTQFMAVLNIIS